MGLFSMFKENKFENVVHDDPNTWTKEYIIHKKRDCIVLIREIADLCIKYTIDGNYKAAVAGLDRIINGLVVMLNAGAIDCGREICMFSWAEANIISFGIEAPDSNKRKTALSLYEDARDFATSQSTKESLSSIISYLEEGGDFSELMDEMEPDFPSDTLDIMKKLRGHFA